MHFVVKLFPEIIVKSPTVRKRMTRTLKSNIQRLLRNPSGKGGKSGDLKVSHDWEKIEIKLPGDDVEIRQTIIEQLSRTPGIVKFVEVVGAEFEGLDQAAKFAHENIGSQLDGKTFCVRVKRHGNHDFKSTDAERAIGRLGPVFEQSPDIAAEQGSEIDDDVRDWSNHTFNESAKHEKHVHVYEQVQDSAMEESTCDHPVPFPLLQNGADVEQVPVHEGGIGQSDQAGDHIARDEH